MKSGIWKARREHIGQTDEVVPVGADAVQQHDEGVRRGAGGGSSGGSGEFRHVHLSDAAGLRPPEN